VIVARGVDGGAPEREHSHHERPICQNASSRKLEVEAVSRARSLLSRVRRPEQPERRRDHHRRDGRRHAYEGHAAPIHGLYGLAEHSGTLTARYEENPAPFGSFHDVQENCNHGRCPRQLLITYLVLTAPRSSTHVHRENCRTLYNPLSSIGTHNCNDDSVCQNRTVPNDTHWPSVGTPCSDSQQRRYAPGPWS